MTRMYRVVSAVASRRGALALFVMLVSGVAAVGCGYSTPTMPYTPAIPGYLIGNFTATVITSTDGDVTTDRLGAGSTLSIALAADHTTSGALVDAGTTFDMTGIWTFDGTTVRITQDAGTFVRVMPFVVTGMSLVGDGTFEGVRFHAVLVPAAARAVASSARSRAVGIDRPGRAHVARSPADAGAGAHQLRRPTPRGALG